MSFIESTKTEKRENRHHDDHQTDQINHAAHFHSPCCSFDRKNYLVPGIVMLKLGPEFPIFPVAIKTAAPMKITKTTPTMTPSIPLAESLPSDMNSSP